MRSLLLMLAVLAGCSTAPQREGSKRLPPTDSTPPSRPGIACGSGLDWHPQLGCTHDTPNLQVIHEDRMSDSFVLTKATYHLNGELLASFVAPPDDGPGQKDILMGDIRTENGQHELAVSLRYQGHGLGVFSYLKGYRFEVRSQHGFMMNGAPRRIAVVASEKGPATTPLEQRPQIRFQVTDL